MTRTAREYFDRLYGQDPDPWGFASRWYERRKYDLTLAALPAPRYRSAFEAGCSIGVLTAGLAARCDRLLAADLVPAAVDAARQRVAGLPGVAVEVRTLPEEWPAGPFDLVVLSEVAYYFDHCELGRLVEATSASAAPGASVVAVHWRGPTDYPLSGDEVHRVLAATAGWRPVVHHAEDDFLLDVWTLP